MASSEEVTGSAAAEAAQRTPCQTHESGVGKADRPGSGAALPESA